MMEENKNLTSGENFSPIIEECEKTPILESEQAPLEENFNGEKQTADDENCCQNVECVNEETQCENDAIEEQDDGRHATAYTDKFVESISPEGVAGRVAKLLKLNARKTTYLFAIIYAMLGIICAIFAPHIQRYFPYIVGGFVAVLGLVMFVHAIITKEYKCTRSNATASALVLIVISIFIFLEGEWATVVIAVTWGVFGLIEGSHALNHAISRICRRKNCLYYLVKALIEFVFAFLLLYHPLEHIALHVFVFGVQLVFDAITMLPIVKDKVRIKE